MKVKFLVVHHSASPRDTTTLAMIWAWHKAEGFRAVGYHRVITGSGLAQQGRPWGQAGAHALHYNSVSEGFCLTGNFEKETPTGQQVNALVEELAQRCLVHGLTSAAIVGHHQLNATACPGRHLIAMLPSIRARVDARRAALLAARVRK